MKLKKVASLLLSGVMLLSQPAYAAGEVNEVVETDVAGEEESLREDTNTDNMGEINVSNETANQEALDSTSSVLSRKKNFLPKIRTLKSMSLMKTEMILVLLELFSLTTYQKKQKQKSVKKLNRK